MTVSKRVGWFLIAFGVWSWVIWPTFLKNIWADGRSWDHGMTTFFAVHLALTVVSLALGTAIGVIGVRALRRGPSAAQEVGAAAAGPDVGGPPLGVEIPTPAGWAMPDGLTDRYGKAEGRRR